MQLTQTQKEYQKLKNQTDTIQNKIDIASSIASYYDSCAYTKQISELK